MSKKRYLEDDYCPPGCRALRVVRGMFGDSHFRIITLERRQKKLTAVLASKRRLAFMIARPNVFVTCLAEQRGFIWKLKFAVSLARAVTT